MRVVATSAAASVKHSGPVPSIPGSGPATRPNMVAVGTMVWLSSELMFFAALFAFYFTLRGHLPDLWDERTAMLNVPFASANTLILVISSVWCQLGVLQAERGVVARPVGTRLTRISAWGMREWYVLTYIFGAVFVAGQVYEYAHLIIEGVTLSSDSYGSIFYLATGFHGMHVTGGLIAFLLILGRTFTTRRYSHAQATGAVVTSYYWHFVDVVWIALFLMIYVLK
ncbi:aa3-type cytochrome oxidase subunit III [Phycicoccus sonneratiae]|uniref:cytochrome-c oxidase n=1 Tax=Phycicoccus sonneratiae TaxID=2807628 RepID=A0ABS2CRD1_9MICO|nr:heme-copper oxidase subunit III [Phycicoccus sonneraticus]